MDYITHLYYLLRILIFMFNSSSMIASMRWNTPGYVTALPPWLHLKIRLVPSTLDGLSVTLNTGWQHQGSLVVACRVCHVGLIWLSHSSPLWGSRRGMSSLHQNSPDNQGNSRSGQWEKSDITGLKGRSRTSVIEVLRKCSFEDRLWNSAQRYCCSYNHDWNIRQKWGSFL